MNITNVGPFKRWLCDPIGVLFLDNNNNSDTIALIRRSLKRGEWHEATIQDDWTQQTRRPTLDFEGALGVKYLLRR